MKEKRAKEFIQSIIDVYKEGHDNGLTAVDVSIDKVDAEALSMGIKALEQRWIPVSERLPEKPDNYPYCGIYRTYFLVSLASGCVEALGYEFDRDEWQVTGSPVVAWMPLPEPYKAESEG